MNKQEAIEIIEQDKIQVGRLVETNSGAHSIQQKVKSVDYVPLEIVVNTIDKIGLKKVVVPKYVAEWIEECKRSGWHLEKVLYRLDDDEKVGDWAYDENDDLIPENVDMIARAWLDGYEIEQEKLYTVEIPNPNANKWNATVLKRRDNNDNAIELCVYVRPDFSDSDFQLTESEIKQDFEWAWDAGFAKEVE
ncbi:DUF1642 domain-containing protein [Streptococcus suis]|uniref:DUF1642 domain-containing protein n=1 Tax=Streptococcus suis TaxID=1307 RepID=A0A116S4B8_STRSU|nr:DUF1642 domain-containing protein [Streptococcus suis]ANM47602.1 hypothetical protein [Streptococcus phage phiZJ20091101-4]AML47522.1 hypothetical protein APQ97_10955 [Streptococcus suis]MBL1132385.1 DUF1642 domain-containing protein [Streptococcus suis]MBM6437593.1 DUF1642 domain-containing protein [Streptococcus suis]MBS0708674.1 DUF1642 domain-containing protein [Streptococcus suis]